jgi:hypothetical protein
MGDRGAQICDRFLILLNKEIKHIVINALAGADLYCIVDACSVDGWVFVEKVTWVNQSGDCWEFHCPNSQNGWDATLHWKVRQNGALTSILGSIISWHLFLSWLWSVEWRWSKKKEPICFHTNIWFFFSSNRLTQFWILSFDKFSVLTPIPILPRLRTLNENDRKYVFDLS